MSKSDFLVYHPMEGHYKPFKPFGGSLAPSFITSYRKLSSLTSHLLDTFSLCWYRLNLDERGLGHAFPRPKNKCLGVDIVLPCLTICVFGFASSLLQFINSWFASFSERVAIFSYSLLSHLYGVAVAPS